MFGKLVYRKGDRRDRQATAGDGFRERQILLHNVAAGRDHATGIEHARKIFPWLGCTINYRGFRPARQHGGAHGALKVNGKLVACGSYITQGRCDSFPCLE